MRKREWKRCTDADAMLDDVWCRCAVPEGYHVPPEIRRRQERRLRLFTLTAGERLWAQLGTSEVCQQAVEAAWRQAEGHLSADEAAEQFEALRTVYDEAFAVDAAVMARIVYVLSWLFRDPLQSACAMIRSMSMHGNHLPFRLLDGEDLRACCGLMRDIFGDRGNLPTLEPDRLVWNTETAVQLAHLIYAERDFDRLPILADAIEEAGCADAALLGHLRGPGPHVRGCWALDLLLGKE